MPKIQRKTQKVFCNSADSDQLAVFGSMSTGTPVYSSDVEELQSNEAFDLGWDAATLEDKAPFMEEMNGVQYGLTYQIAYGLQEGIPEYDSATTYYIGSICKVLEDGKPILYTSLTDDNIGNDPVNDSTNWERLSFGGGGLEIGDIGIAPLGIDETKGKRRYLNGQLIIQEQYVQFTDKVKSAVALYPSLACTESEWQTTATMTVGGQVGKFVIDDEAGTIRLPKIIMPIQGLTDLSKLAEIVEAGLPTHTHTRGTMEITGYFQGSGNISGAGGGAFYTATGLPKDNGFNSSNTFDAGYRFAASRSWTGSTSTGNYSKALATTDTVQQEQIQYPYFIQVATGAETEDNIINEIELNNPFSLLDYKYSEYELNNLSWLRSEGQWNAKAIYPAVYDLLLKIYNGVETKAGVSVKLTTETFTDYDFVLNTAEETFRLPLKVKLANLTSEGIIPVYATDGSNKTYNFTTFNGADNYNLYDSMYLSGAMANNKKSHNFTMKADLSQVVNSALYLYFYVGETVQNANLVNIGRIQETYTTKSMVDGQWVSKNLVLLDNVVLTSETEYIYDLSEYLPNDGYIYEIIGALSLKYSTTSAGSVTGSVKTSLIDWITVCSAISVNKASYEIGTGSFNVPIGLDKKLILTTDNSANYSYLRIVAYRRIGTNL